MKEKPSQVLEVWIPLSVTVFLFKILNQIDTSLYIIFFGLCSFLYLE